MANKKISELESRASLSLSDLMAVGDPSTGYLYKTTISDLKTLTGAGVVSFNGRFGTVNPAEGDYTLTQLGDVIITSPSNGQVLKFNGSNWVNASDVTEADTLDTVTTRGNTTANSITVGSVTAAGLSNLLGQIKTFVTTGNTYIGANPTSATDAGFKLDVNGTTRLNGATSVTGVLTGSDTIRSTNGTVTVSISYGSTAGIIGTTSNHSLELRTNNTYRVGVSTAGVVNVSNLAGTGSRIVVADAAGNLSASSALTGYVTLDTFQTITASKTFSVGFSLASAGGANQLTSFANANSIHSGSADTNVFGFNSSNNIYFGKGLSNGGVIAWNNSVVRSYTLPNADGTIALTSDIPSVAGVYLPLAGGTLTGALAGTSAAFTSSGSGDTFAITHSSGSGIALNITKGGNGEGLYINKTSGTGNAATIIGTLNATTLVKSGGTSSQFLKADGSVDSNTYLTSASVSGVYLPLSGGTLTGALNGTSAVFSSSVSAQQLIIKNSGVPAAQFYRDLDVTVVGSAGQGIEFGARSGSTYIAGAAIYGGLDNPATTGSLVFQTLTAGSLTTKLTINSAGAATFSSSVTASGYSYFDGLRLKGSDNGATIWKDSGDMSIYPQNGKLYLGGQGISNVITVTSANVGIGITTPAGAHMLQIHNPSQNYVRMNMTNTATGTSNSDGLIFQQEVGNSIIKNQENGYLAFGVNGAENNLVIAQGGNVGINTTNPGERLTVNGGIGMQRSGTQIWHYAVDASNNLNFTRSGIADRFTITSDGNIGIGVTPSAWGSNRTALQFGALGAVFSDNNVTSEIGANVYISTAPAYTYITSNYATRFTQINGQFQWQQAPSGTAGNAISFTQAMTLDASGNLGLGTTSLQATYKVTISGTDTIFPAIYLENTTNSQAYSIRATGTNFVVRDNTSGNDRFTIASTGAATFSSSVTANKLITAFDSVSGTIDFGTGVYKGIMNYSASTGIWSFNNQSAGSSPTLYYQFQADGSPIMSMLKNGNVGINTTNPGALLHVGGASGNTLPTNAQAIFEFNSNGGIVVSVPTGNAGGIYFPYSTTAYYAGVDRYLTDLRFLNGDAVRLTIASTGLATFTGDVKVKTLEVTNVGTDATSSGVSTYMRITVNGQNYLIPLHGTP